MKSSQKTSRRTVLLQTGSPNKIYVCKGKLLTSGGFSEVFAGELDPSKNPVAIKVIKVTRQDSVITKSLRHAVKDFLSFINKRLSKLKTLILNQNRIGDALEPGEPPQQAKDEEGSGEQGPSSLSRAEIELEISSLRRFQENRFIIQFLGTSKLPSTIWIVTELAVSDIFTLSEEMIQDDEQQFWDHESMVIHLLAPILNALLFVHEQGYIHRDIKPSNIVLDQAGIPKLIDFGLCAELAAESGTFSSIHGSGSPYFMSPEAVKSLPLTAKSDAFSFAATASTLRAIAPPYTLYSGEGWEWKTISDWYRESSEGCKEEYEAVKKYMVDYVKGEIRNRYVQVPSEPWEAVAEDVAKLIAVEVDERGTLEDLAANKLFVRVMADWNKFPCRKDQLSRSFLRHRGFIAKTYQKYGIDNSSVLEYENL